MKKSVVVIGAGPAGMTAAYELSKHGHDVCVFEAEDGVGGMARTMPLWGQKVDLGPHRFFSNDRRINELWLEVVGRDYSMIDRLTRIYYKGRFFFYPLQPVDALKNLGVWEAVKCSLSYARAVACPPQDTGSFESWVERRFGRRLYEIFFKSYSEKLWGLKCDDLDADFAAQRIQKLSLSAAIWNAFLGGRGNKHKTLVDQFAYPHGGTGRVYERMAERVTGNGGRVRLSTRVRRAMIENDACVGVETENGESIRCDHVISSIPITSLVATLPNVPQVVRHASSQLAFRNTILVYLEVQASNLFPDNWLYVHAPELRCGRITNFRNWTPDLHGGNPGTILCLEYWCNSGDSIWTEPAANLIGMATQEIRHTGLIGQAQITNGHVRLIPRCYPVYSRGYKAHLGTIIDHLRGIANLTLIGRYGTFKYNNQDHSILMGLLAAENVGLGQKHDLWAVNSIDAYHEEARITATGLAVTASAECPG